MFLQLTAQLRAHRPAGGSPDVVLGAAARRACLRHLEDVASLLHRSDAREHELHLAAERKLARKLLKARKRARVPQASPLVATVPPESLVGVLAFLGAKDLAQVACTQLGRSSDGAGGETEAFREGVAAVLAAKFGAEKVTPTTSPSWHAVCILEDAAAAVDAWRGASPENLVLDRFEMHRIVNITPLGGNVTGGGNYGPVGNVKVHMENLLERTRGRTNAAQHAYPHSFGSKVNFRSEAVSNAIDESIPRARYCKLSTLMAAVCLVGEGGMHVPSFEFIKGLHRLVPEVSPMQAILAKSGAAQWLSVLTTLDIGTNPEVRVDFGTRVAPLDVLARIFSENNGDASILELLCQKILDSGLLEACVQILSSAPSSSPASDEEKKKLRKALTSIEKLRRLRNGSTGQYVGIFYKKVDQIMVSNPLFPKSFLAHFREQVHSLTSMLLRDGEDGGEEQPPINPRMIRYEIQDWLNLLCDFHEPRPLFSARLLEVGFAQMLDGLMPDLSERPGGANQYQRLVAKSIADAKAQLLRPTMTSRQSMSRSRWSPRSSSSSLGLGSGDAGYLLLS